jgi:hypothetical protein
LLRKCKLLAARLGSEPLGDWLVLECNGYPDGVAVPAYRIWPLELKGHFSGAFQSMWRNAPIPRGCVPEKIRSGYQAWACRPSIASIEDTVKKSPTGIVCVSAGDLAVTLGTRVLEGHNCLQAWGEFSVCNLVEVLNAVRNRILDFAIAIWREAPGAGDLETVTSQDESKKFTQMFHTIVYGGTANILGAAVNSSVNFTVTQSDMASLERVLAEAGISERDFKRLRSALAADERPRMGAGFGPRVSKWMAEMVKKAAEGAWKVGVAAAGSLLEGAISKYYGL